MEQWCEIQEKYKVRVEQEWKSCGRWILKFKLHVKATKTMKQRTIWSHLPPHQTSCTEKKQNVNIRDSKKMFVKNLRICKTHLSRETPVKSARKLPTCMEFRKEWVACITYKILNPLIDCALWHSATYFRVVFFFQCYNVCSCNYQLVRINYHMTVEWMARTRQRVREELKIYWIKRNCFTIIVYFRMFSMFMW